MSDDPSSLEESCAACHSENIDVSLVLSCDHRLCLPCSRQRLRWLAGDPTVECPGCHMVTYVEHGAASYLSGTRDRGRPSSECPTTPHWSSGRSTSPTPLRDETPTDDEPGSWQGPVLDSSPSQTWPGTFSTTQTEVTDHSTGSPMEEFCGQCQTETVKVHCVQCAEQFCTACAGIIHKAGRMRLHQLQPVDCNSGQCSTEGGHSSLQPNGAQDVIGTPPRRPTFGRWPAGLTPGPATASTGRTFMSSETGRTFISSENGETPFFSCPVHHDELAHFFCLSCQDGCICAECAVSGAHRGHDVHKVHKAYDACDSNISDLLQLAQKRAQEEVRKMEELRSMKQDLYSNIDLGRVGIQEAFAQLHQTLKEQESLLHSGVDNVVRTLTEGGSLLHHSVEKHAKDIRDTEKLLWSIDTRAGEVRAFNEYVALKRKLVELQKATSTLDAGTICQIVQDALRDVQQRVSKQVELIDKISGHASDLRRTGAER